MLKGGRAEAPVAVVDVEEAGLICGVDAADAISVGLVGAATPEGLDDGMGGNEGAVTETTGAAAPAAAASDASCSWSGFCGGSSLLKLCILACLLVSVPVAVSVFALLTPPAMTLGGRMGSPELVCFTPSSTFHS